MMVTGSLVLAGWLLLGGVVSDTVVPIRSGETVVVEGLVGRLEVVAWDRHEVAISGAEGRGDRWVITREGGRVVVSHGDPRARGRDLSVTLRVPATAPLEVRSRQLDVSASGLGGLLQVGVIEGDIRAVGITAGAILSTVSGTIRVEDAAGTLSLRSRGDDVSVLGAQGVLEVVSGSGDVTLEQIRATSVSAETLDGDLVFRGALLPGGTYRFSVHDGNAEVSIPPGSGARATVATFHGEFTSDFPVTLQGYGGGGSFDFVLGSGGPVLDIKVFDGDIRLISSGPSR